VRGAAAPETAVRTAWSLSTLHEQMIIAADDGDRDQTDQEIRHPRAKSKGKNTLYSASNLVRLLV
jgi:hypothetical protein